MSAWHQYVHLEFRRTFYHLAEGGQREQTKKNLTNNFEVPLLILLFVHQKDYLGARIIKDRNQEIIIIIIKKNQFSCIQPNKK